jgi:resuscitation-promoting factor RpfA
MRQRLRAVGQSLAGDGMLLRLRNASIALVATVTAVGLGLTLFIAQLGFPGVFSSPIPANPTKVGIVHDAVALTRSPAVSRSSAARGERASAITAGRLRHAGRAGGGKGTGSGAGRGGSRRLAVSPGSAQNPAGQPKDVSAPAPTPAPAPTEPAAPAPAPSPAPVPVVVESPSGPSSSGQSKGTSDSETNSNTPSSAKARGDSSAKPKGLQITKSGGQTASVAKSNSSPSEKAGKDRSAASAPKSVAPPATPQAKPVPETASPAAAKEAADDGRSDSHHH